jgi:hypothetical protein
MAGSPRYAPSASKALEVILWLATYERGVDLYHLVKAAFFADKFHVPRYGRPIIGDEYAADVWGPLPQVVYRLLNHSPFEILALNLNGPLPFKVEEGSFRVYADRDPNLGLLSESDIEALSYGLSRVRGKSFDDLVKETHADPAYRRAEGGKMDYREFIPDDDPDKKEKADYLTEVSAYAVF